MWFAAGSATRSPARREALLDAACAVAAGRIRWPTARAATSPQAQVVLLRVLAHRVEPVHELLAARLAGLARRGLVAGRLRAARLADLNAAARVRPRVQIDIPAAHAVALHVGAAAALDDLAALHHQRYWSASSAAKS